MVLPPELMNGRAMPVNGTKPVMTAILNTA